MEIIETKKEMIKKVKDFFNLLDVYYEEVSDFEIKIPCPADTLPYDIFYEMTAKEAGQKEIINHKEMMVASDEGAIYILADDYGELSWLAVAPRD
jgi:hypothetical protein